MGAGTPNRHLTFFGHRSVTWNQAVEICEAIDSQLIEFDSEDVYNAIKDFSEGIWKDKWFVYSHPVTSLSYSLSFKTSTKDESKDK